MERDYGSDSTSSAAAEHHTPQQRGKRGRGLNTQTLCHLLRDIEENGGIHLVSAKSVCDRNPRVYGEPGSERRRQVLQKISKWKLLPPEKYRIVLFTAGVVVDAEENGTSGVVGIGDDAEATRIVTFHPGSSPQTPAGEHTDPYYLRSSHQFFTPPPPEEAPAQMAHSTSIVPAANADSAYIHRLLATSDYGKCFT
jgi:hypothetical protein